MRPNHLITPFWLIVALFLACQGGEPPSRLAITDGPALAPVSDAEPLDTRAPTGEQGTLTPLPSRDHEVTSLTDFIGADACQECHEEQHRLWRRSTHGVAGSASDTGIIIPRKRERKFRFSDALVSMSERQGRAYFEIRRGQDDQEADRERVSIDGIVGVDAMVGGGGQAYFHRTDEGLLMHLPFEFNRAARRWFCQRRVERIVSGTSRVDYQWMEIDGTFPIAECVWPPKRTLGFTNRKNCGNCHGSQIDVTFDAEQRQFRTHTTSFRINCESCHGPGRRHADLMKTNGTSSQDIGLASLDTFTKVASVRVCMACHASKSIVDPGYVSGAPFDRYFSMATLGDPAMRMVHFDGRTADFGYQEGHLYSECYLGGSMTCVDCHDPHDQSYRDVHGRTLVGRFDDGQCLGCHPSKDGTAHQQHGSGDRKASCVGCHMPFHQHPSVPSHFKMQRSDHTVAIPRPKIDEEVGVRNACDRCHDDRDIEWQRSGLTQLYGQTKPRPALVEALFSIAAQRDGRESTRREGPSVRRKSAHSIMSLVTTDSSIRAISALSYLVQDWLFFVDEGWQTSAIGSVQALIEAKDPDVRAAAYATLFFFSTGRPELQASTLASLRKADAVAPGLRAKIQQSLYSVFHAFGHLDHGKSLRVLEQVAPLLNIQPTRLLAVRAKALLAEKRHDDAVALYELAANHESLRGPRHHLGVGAGTAYQFWVEAGNVRMNQGRPQDAVYYFTRAQGISPADVNSKRGLWTALAMTGREREALPILKQYLELVPSFIDGHLYQGQMLLRLGRRSEAVRSLKRALEFKPDDERAIELLRRASMGHR